MSADRELDAYVAELTRDWPPPDKPEQIAVLRKTFGRFLIQDPAAGSLAKVTPAAGRHTTQKGIDAA